MSGSTASARELGGEPRPAVSFEDMLRAHRRELLVHCYRMLGSWTDAEDVFQDVSLRAWRGFDRFEGRASARSWLYRIATNACLTALRGRSQRTLPDVSIPAAPVGGPLAPPADEERWIQPFPTGRDVETVASSRESVTLAFVVALQHLPPRQRAALLLRDVVGYEAREVAAMLKTSTSAVNSALMRARARIARFGGRGVEARIVPLSPGQQQLLSRYMKAWEGGDVDAIVALFSGDASASMPPFATWYRGRVAIARWLTDHALADGRAYRLFRTSANGRPAFAFYKAGGPCLPGEPVREALEPHCIQVVWLARRQVTRIVSFLNARLVKEFGFGPRPLFGPAKK
jgi:RNA polymerase sigma-70 factor (ECF subfamily)